MKPHSSGMNNATAQLCKPIESCNIQLSKTCFEMSVALNIQILHAFVWDQVERFKYSFVAYLNLCCCCLIVGFSSNFELSKLASPLSKIGSKFWHSSSSSPSPSKISSLSNLSQSSAGTTLLFFFWGFFADDCCRIVNSCSTVKDYFSELGWWHSSSVWPDVGITSSPIFPL